MKRGRPTLAAVPLLVLGLLGLQRPVVAQQQRNQDDEFARQWKEVKQKYPLVAMAYLRREAFVRAVGETSLTRCDHPRPDGRPAWLILPPTLCVIYELLGLPLPPECRTVSFPPGRYADCFDPQPNAEGGYEMPDAEEAEACLRAAQARRR